ncbi:MAG: type II secretion system protein, partial [Pirellulaceae bacterium]
MTKRNRKCNRRQRRHGFTLMEVLLVMAILVMLGALVATNFMGIFAKSKKDAAAAQMLL